MRIAIVLTLASSASCARLQLLSTQPRNEGVVSPAHVTSGPVSVPAVNGFDVCNAVGNSYDRYNIDPSGRAGVVSIKSSSGYELCRAYDSNRNGSFETWQVLSETRPVRIAQSSGDNSIFDEYAVFPDPLRLDCPVVFRRSGGGERVKSDACGLTTRPAPTNKSPARK